MPLTDQLYGANTAGVGRVIQDFGLCNLKGEYLYTAKARVKGLLVVVFFAPTSAPSVRALETVQAWATEMAGPKWSALAVTEGDRDEIAAWAEGRKIDAVPILLDHELYQTRRWGVSHLPHRLPYGRQDGPRTVQDRRRRRSRADRDQADAQRSSRQDWSPPTKPRKKPTKTRRPPKPPPRPPRKRPKPPRPPRRRWTSPASRTPVRPLKPDPSLASPATKKPPRRQAPWRIHHCEDGQ